MMDSPVPPSPARARFSKSLLVGIAFITTIGVGLATFTAVRALNPGPRPALALTPVGARKALAFSMPALDGKTWRLADQGNRVILLNYFATWCAPCLEELPDLEEMQKAYGARGFEMAAISINQESDEGHTRAQVLGDFAGKRKLPFPILLPPGDSPLLHEEFPIPQSLIVDRHGRVALHITGRIDPAQVKPLIEQLLSE